MNKKGQFFLIAAVVIAGIIITLGVINISTKQVANEETSFYDLSKEIDYESSQLIDYGVYEAQTPQKISASVVSFVSNYSAANPDTEMLLVYGNKDILTVLFYNQSSSGAISIGSAETPQITITPKAPYYNRTGNNDEIITVHLAEGSELKFELKPEGENFFIVLKKQSGEETLVA